MDVRDIPINEADAASSSSSAPPPSPPDADETSGQDDCAARSTGLETARAGCGAGRGVLNLGHWRDTGYFQEEEDEQPAVNRAARPVMMPSAPASTPKTESPMDVMKRALPSAL